MVLGGHPSLNIFRAEAESSMIFSTASSLEMQLQQVEERCLQAQKKGEQLRSKRTELIEVLRVFEMIEDSEKEKTRELEREVACAEMKITERYSRVLGNTGTSWTPVEVDASGSAIEHHLAKCDQEQEKQHFLDIVGAKEEHVKSTIPDICKQMLAAIIPSSPMKAVDVENTPVGEEDTEFYRVGPRAPLIPRNGKDKRPVRKLLALEKAKQKAAEHWKTMPHKARRKLRAAQAPTFVTKKTLVYTGEAIKSGMASGFGKIGELWNARRSIEELKTSETWPEGLQEFLSSRGRSVVMGGDSETRDDAPV